MKKRILFRMTVVALALASCGLENDMMLPKDEATFTAFEVEGQVSSSINSTKRVVTVTMPQDEALNSLEITKVSYNEATVNLESLPVEGQTVDLSDTLRLTLKAYREFEWKLIAKNQEVAPTPEPGPDPTPEPVAQLYNLSFDFWSKPKYAWFPYDDDATDEQKSIWATSNQGTADILRKNATTPEESFLAIGGEGKKAAKLSSQWMVIKFASGNLFTGEFCGLKGTSGADLAWGVPYTDRPSALHGYYCYQPVEIDRTDSEHSSMKGQMDIGQIQVILADWDKNKWEGYPEGAIDEKGRFHVINSSNQFVDFENDPAIIGYANFEFNEWMDSYQEFDIPIVYRNDRKPSVIVICAASSRYGDFFTGGAGSVLYLDEFVLKD